MANVNPAKKSWTNFFKRFEYDEDKDKAHQVRNVLLVIAALIAAVTFLAGVNPPGGVWQDTDKGHIAGTAIYAANPIPFKTFLMFNTMALSSSLFVILCLTRKFPFYIEICIASLSMLATYVSAIVAVTPHGAIRFRYVLFAAVVPLVVRFLKCVSEE